MTDTDNSDSPSVSSSTGSHTVETAASAAAALVLVSTPIGNLKDFSARARETLESVDAILCEDTRTSGVLLHAYGIKTKLIALHDHNEDSRAPGLVKAMLEGRRYALISDAGTPLVSDPGYRLVRAAIAAGVNVGGVPGANAAVFALTLSGLPPQPFLFLGFLPVKGGARLAALGRIANAEAAGLAATIVVYEAPHRLGEMLADAVAVFGDRPAAVCRELTKHFEEVRRGGLVELAAHYAEHAARGEITVVIGPATAEPVTAAVLDESLAAALGRMSLKDAVDAVTAATGLPRRQVYARALGFGKAG